MKLQGPRKFIGAATAALTLAVAASSGIVASAERLRPKSGDWPTVGGDPGNTRYSVLSQINVSNVKKLGGAWLKEFRTPTRTPPVIAGDFLYTADGTTVYALNPQTGATLWEYTPQGSTPARGGVAIGEGYVFCGLNESRVVALDQKSGKLVWTGFIGNSVPENAEGGQHVDFGPGMPTFNRMVGAIANAPTYVNGVVTSGLTGGDGGVPGKISGLDARTGFPCNPDAWRAGNRNLACRR
jgi:quinohemoprotein ethanol dehydrogenase